MSTERHPGSGDLGDGPGDSGIDVGEVQFGETLVRAEGLSKHFNSDSGFLGGLTLKRDGGPIPLPTYDREWVRAVDDVSFEIKKGETVGLVGESGCGKSTLARTIIKLLKPSDGAVYFKGKNLAEMSGEPLRTMRRDMQIIFQDPQSSLDPRMKVGQIVEEPMRAHGLPESDPSVATTADLTVERLDLYDVSVTMADDVDVVVPPQDGLTTVPITIRPSSDNVVEADDVVVTVPNGLATHVEVDAAENEIHVQVTVGWSKKELRRERARELLSRVGLDPQHYNRYPHQFSGGQRQRINLARALSVDPDFIVCDEPTSALDASIQAQVLNTMKNLQDEFGLTYLFISHDLSVIRYIADRVAVMYLGEIVELADKEELFENPQHPYTEALLEAIPVPDPRSTGTRDLLEGDVPSPIDPPSGCRFRTRCPKLIAPDEYDLTSQEWANVRSFMRAVDRRKPEATNPSSERELRETFFSDGSPGGEAGRLVSEAIDLMMADEWEEATEILVREFAEQSICAREVPRYEVEAQLGTSAHYAHCHLNHEEYGE